MQIFPAIDLKGGRVVRPPDGTVVYDPDPVRRAAEFLAAGCRWLHVVDLDRAFKTGGDNSGIIRSITALPEARIQLGGLLRTAAEVEEGFSLGAARVVLSTELACDPAMLKRTAELFPRTSLAVNIDVRAGKLVLRGSEARVDLSPVQLLERAVALGIGTVVYRDLAREGTLGGPDIEGAAALVGRGAEVILSAGFGGIEELKAAAAAGIAGVILGRAVYEGKIELREAVSCFS
ncbi:MAG: 1-(5-phosphoribosyl)-5-[(5-phosphoribosylamino) methylideneamino] imidazole-4-carboxamide isomerase [Gemmatimonadales bacterium]|nr:1-(5-phosphoribosyl)-5-[(5-phosphoribosylamino) methylideneamino] imidazole-4-carboxamide isomerase [bacterium HR33]GIW51298.1 MAG: 1-(5-phosphoribosyl)-5-[(5-phosphoribosylamino) methylideneamino] imidazole-4-carboxamide isomerase [Gemmatimonadales bacterium]